MNCIFCNKACFGGGIVTDAHHCFACKSSFLAYHSNNVYSVYMSCKINDTSYQLQLDYLQKYSRIVILPDHVDATMIMVADFPFLLKNVTPTNLAYKIKTYVTFS